MLLTVADATALLGLKSKASVYRKINNGELSYVRTENGAVRIESEGLEERWRSITRTRADSPTRREKQIIRSEAQQEARKELRPIDERTAPRYFIDSPPESVTSIQLGDEELPDYSVSRARSEYEKANLLELERKVKESQLVPRKAVETTWAKLITDSKTRLLGLPSRAKARIPHLSLEEVEILTVLVREALEELSGEDAGVERPQSDKQ